jgi:hypothetical protein
MSDSDREVKRLAAMLRDPQFWVPVAVLAGGLVVLQWIR